MKKLFTCFMALFMLLSLNAKTIYFDAVMWDADNAWFSAWVFEQGKDGSWVKATKGIPYYTIEVPDNITGIVMVRFSPDDQTENWDTKWNQTDDIEISAGNLITITDWGQDKSPVSQSTYNPDEPLPVLEFALIGELNGSSISTYEEGIKFTSDSDNELYTLETKFTDSDEQKLQLIDAEGNIWARNDSKSITDIDTDPSSYATMKKGEKTGTADITTSDLEAVYKFTFTLESLSKGKLTYEITEGSLDPTDVEETVAELIYAEEGTIIAPAPFAIIDLNGKDVTNANGSLQGTYIVKTQNSVAKISVK
jgi:hypothetical protein